MSKLLVSNSITLDGVFEAPAKAPLETFVFAGWTEPYQSKEQNDYLASGISGGGALLMGRVTYEHMKAGWARASGPVADFMNNATKYVASTTMKRATWKNTTLIKGDVAEAVARLKRESGQDLAVLGSGKLCQTLRKADLIDEYSLLVFPLVLGKGKRFFTGGGWTGLKLQEARPFSSGVVLMTYVPDRK
jgi:dihydrofolate reductase